MLNRATTRFFATVKKQKMELTLRTPYQTYLKDFDGFSRILTKTNEAALIVQNKAPAALYVLPPGHLKVKMVQEVQGVSGDYLHLGGWLIVHADNSCEVNLMDAFEKKEIKVDHFDKYELPKDYDDMAGKYATKLRKLAAKAFIKKAA